LPYQAVPKYLIFDRDAKYGLEVPIAVRSMNLVCVRPSFRSPWQNGVAERWIESCRRDLLDNFIAVDERHSKRPLADYIRYYHDDRTRLCLNKGTPKGRTRSTGCGRVVALARLGGLRHRYARAA
jgi:putative transposase